MFVCVCVCVYSLSVSVSMSVSVPSLSPSLPTSLTSVSFFFDLPKRCILEETGRYPALPDAPLTELSPRPTRPAHCHSRRVNVALLRPFPVRVVLNNCRARAAELRKRGEKKKPTSKVKTSYCETHRRPCISLLYCLQY